MFLSHSEIDQLGLLKKKSPVERFYMMSSLIGGQMEIMKAGLKHRHQEMSEEELHQCLKLRMKKIYSLNR